MGKQSGDIDQELGTSTTVRALRVLPSGPAFWLHDLARKPAPEHSLRIGKAEYCDIVIRDNPGVEDTHCFLLWSRDRLEVRDFAPGKLTLFNGIAVVDGHALLGPSDVLSIGTAEQVTHIMACRESLKESPRIPVCNIQELIIKAHEYHGSKEQTAAKGIKVNRMTYARKLAKLIATVAILCGVLGAGMWLSADTRPGPRADRAETEESTPVARSPSAEPAQVQPAAAAVAVPSVETEAKAATVAPTSRKARPTKKRRRVRKAKAAEARAEAETAELPAAPAFASPEPTSVPAEPRARGVYENAPPRARGVFNDAPTGARGVTAADRQSEKEVDRASNR